MNIPLFPAGLWAFSLRLVQVGGIIKFAAFLNTLERELLAEIQADPLHFAPHLIWAPEKGLVSVRPVVGMGVTERGWTDRDPCEVVKAENDWADVRPMHAEGGLKKDHVFIPGGFVGHVVDQHSAQEWKLTSSPSAPITRIRKEELN